MPLAAKMQRAYKSKAYVFSSSQSRSAKPFLESRMASSCKLISNNCNYRYCFSTYHKLFVDMNSVTKTNIMQSIHVELQICQGEHWKRKRWF